ncbi:MAG: serine/threonine-protein kinase [Planctomycetota bacterium]|jgi:serine/threonine protein kinase
MSLTAGQSLSFYEILGPLGAGAMGEVYRAKDTRLEREVAIKVLPEHFAEDDERLRRFEREAKSLASLNHPNVAQIFGVDQVDDTCFLVLELVPGETLEDRISRGALPVDEAIDVCRQIAEGLEAAHEAGVIHRDLKPANVRITPDGKVKVLDFGLAKPAVPGKDGSSTDSVLATEAGRLLGTPTYMAPEQARGKPIDRRVDNWAFGCVLFECLTARRAFDGESLSDVLAGVLEHEPDWTALPAGVPGRVRRLMERCLVKDPHERLRDVGDARLELADAFARRWRGASLRSQWR